MKIFLYFSVFISLTGCISHKNDFEKYYQSFSNIILPLNVECGFQNSNKLNDRHQSIINNYLPKGAEPYGRIYNKQPNIYLLYSFVGDILYPYLFIYDKSGNQLDSMYLHIEYCNISPNSQQINYTLINPDCSMLMVDTIKTWINEDLYPDSVSIEIIKKLYKMNNKGLFDEAEIH